MIHAKLKRSAFTFLELTFVIVILGIVASLGSEMIVKVYENYILEKAQHSASIKTELAITQIANRLRYAIPGTIIRRQTKTSSNAQAEELSTFMHYPSDSYKVLQWVAYDGDSFEAISSAADRLPGWSGFNDLDVSTNNTIKSPGSKFSLANSIIGNLSANTGAKTIADATVYFPGDSADYGIASAAGDILTLDANMPTGSSMSEHYKLSWTSYALVCENGSADYPCGDLYLYYNFSPTFKATIGVTRSLLLTNVYNFKFQGAGRTTRIKICKPERISEDINDSNISSCKEKAVF